MKSTARAHCVQLKSESTLQNFGFGVVVATGGATSSPVPSMAASREGSLSVEAVSSEASLLPLPEEVAEAAVDREEEEEESEAEEEAEAEAEEEGGSGASVRWRRDAATETSARARSKRYMWATSSFCV